MARWCNNVTNSPFESELATLGVTSTDNLCDDCGGVTSSSREDEEGDECDPEQVVRSAEAHYAYKSVKSLYAYRTGECDNLQLLCLECKVMNERDDNFWREGTFVCYFCRPMYKMNTFNFFFVSMHF